MIVHNAEGYERHLGRWSSSLGRRFIDFAGVQDGDRVLDVGSGTGLLALALAGSRSCSKIIGMDLSLSYIEFAKGRTQDPKLQFHIADAASLPYAKNTFDKTLAQFLLNHVSNARGVVGEMRRVTKWGGIVAACVWAAGSHNERSRIFWEAAMAVDRAAREKREAERDYGHRGKLVSLWTECGLKEIKEETLAVSVDFGSFEHFWSPYLEGQGHAAAYLKSLSPDLQHALEVRVRKEILGAKGNGPLSLHAQAVAVQGIC
jgi:SAM-dependent methyltransferase